MRTKTFIKTERDPLSDSLLIKLVAVSDEGAVYVLPLSVQINEDNVDTITRFYGKDFEESITY